MSISASRLSLLVAGTAAALTLGACQRHDEQTAGQTVDRAIERSEQVAQQTRDAGESAAERMKQKAESAADRVGSAVDDAAVTASVNAELAKDPQLSALRIDVDTHGGRVLLTGQAPDAQSRERATQLASAVKGVTSVENHLRIGG